MIGTSGVDGSRPDAALIADLQGAFDRALRAAVPTKSRVALVGFPAHGNVGDSAVWLGTRRALERLRISTVYACDWRTYRQADLRHALSEADTILISGGGNFGDLWPGEQELRERVMADFSHQRTVQLPQSIHFNARHTLERARRLVEGHRDFTLVVREQQSYALAQQTFEAPVELWPDACFGLGSLTRSRLADRALVVLQRNDEESAHGPLPWMPHSTARGDWLQPFPGEARLGFGEVSEHHEALAAQLADHGYPSSESLDNWLLTLDPLASARLRRGCSFLSRGEVVVTDRLHGHLLSLLLDLPHVLLDNSYGKVRSTFETWTSGSVRAVWAETTAQAGAAVEALVHSRSQATLASEHVNWPNSETE